MYRNIKKPVYQIAIFALAMISFSLPATAGILDDLNDIEKFFVEQQKNKAHALPQLPNTQDIEQDVVLAENSFVAAEAYLDSLPLETKVIDLSGVQIYNKPTEFKHLRTLPSLEKFLQVEKLILCNTSLTSFSGIEKLANLKYLYLNDTEITSLKGIEKLKKLAYLGVSRTPLSTIAELEELNIKILDISHTRIRSIEEIRKLKKIEELDISDTNISSIDALAELKELKEVNICETDVASIEILNELRKLRRVILTSITPVVSYRRSHFSGIPDHMWAHQLSYLNQNNPSAQYPSGIIEKLEAKGCRIQWTQKKLEKIDRSNMNITSLSAIGNLRERIKTWELSVSANPIVSLAGIENLVNLRILDLSNTAITSLAGIENLEYLVRLNITNTPHLKDADDLIAILEARGCQIIGKPKRSWLSW